jgi:hypothetical protein
MHARRRALAALIALALAAPLRAGGSEQEVFEKAYSMDGISKISVENVNGNIAATAWDKPYFKVRAVKKAEGGHAEETLRLTEIRVQKIGDEIKVETINPKRRRLFGFLDFGSSGAHVDYELQIPGKTDVRFETCNGKLVASGFAGTISSDAVNGSIELAGIAGPTSANTVNGSVRLAFAGPLDRRRLRQELVGALRPRDGQRPHRGQLRDAGRGQVWTEGGPRQLQRRNRAPSLRDRQRDDPAQDKLTRAAKPPRVVPSAARDPEFVASLVVSLLPVTAIRFPPRRR